MPRATTHKKPFGEIARDLVPSRDTLVTTQEVVKYFKDKDYPFALRTLTKYAIVGLIPKPIHVGNKGYYEKDYIFGQLEAIYVLKAVFQCSLEKIKEIANNRCSNLRATVEVLHSFALWVKKTSGAVAGGKTFAGWLANDTDGRVLIHRFIDQVADGEDPTNVEEYLVGEWRTVMRKRVEEGQKEDHKMAN